MVTDETFQLFYAVEQVVRRYLHVKEVSVGIREEIKKSINGDKNVRIQ